MAEHSLARRQFLRGKFLQSLQSVQEQQQGLNPIRLPWALSEAEFVQGCTACGDCFSVCESRIIVRGANGLPEIDFSQGECTFCRQCVEHCPQPLFRPVEMPAWTHKIEIKHTCLSQHQIECRSCGDSCSNNAIRFRLSLGKVAQPQVDLDYCNGCGACLTSCPTNAIAIITLNTNLEIE